MTRAFVFPGQGSQTVGMGKSLAEAFPAARHVFEEVDDALRESLSTLIFAGPESELTLTANAQPALMAVSLAVIRVLEREFRIDLPVIASHVAGHSLGEYSALAAAGALELAAAARLLRLRGMREDTPGFLSGHPNMPLKPPETTGMSKPHRTLPPGDPEFARSAPSPALWELAAAPLAKSFGRGDCAN